MDGGISSKVMFALVWQPVLIFQSCAAYNVILISSHVWPMIDFVFYWSTIERKVSIIDLKINEAQACCYRQHFVNLISVILKCLALADCYGH